MSTDYNEFNGALLPPSRPSIVMSGAVTWRRCNQCERHYCTEDYPLECPKCKLAWGKETGSAPPPAAQSATPGRDEAGALSRPPRTDGIDGDCAFCGGRFILSKHPDPEIAYWLTETMDLVRDTYGVEAALVYFLNTVEGESEPQQIVQRAMCQLEWLKTQEEINGSIEQEALALVAPDEPAEGEGKV